MSTTLIIGERGEGKTTLTLFLSRKRTSVQVWFQPKADETVDEQGEFVYTSAELYEALQRAKDKGNGTIIFVPSGDDVQESFTEFMDVFRTNNPKIPYAFGGISIVIDEGWLLMNSKSSHPKLEHLLRIAPRAGEFAIEVFVLCHRPKDVNTRTHTLVDEIFVFRMSEIADLETLEKNYHSRLGEIVKAFPDGEHLVARYDKRKRKVEIMDNPQVWKQ